MVWPPFHFIVHRNKDLLYVAAHQNRRRSIRLWKTGGSSRVKRTYPNEAPYRMRQGTEGTTAMLFTGFIAALIARFYGHQAQRLRDRRLPPMHSDASRDGDEDGPGAGKSGPLTRNC
jgi:hypothetical protein